MYAEAVRHAIVVSKAARLKHKPTWPGSGNAMSKWTSVRTMAAATAAVSLATAASAQTRGVTASEVTFGMHTDLSGVAATYGVSSSNGVKMRFEEVNAAGGINGRKLN